MPLEEYGAKRDFAKTPEPGAAGAQPGGGGSLRFVVQKHHASSLHYDFRLELDGVLLSWAVPKGPSLDPRDKRLAIHVEDHPLDYADFEGTIPEGEYGGGTVIVWDRGTWEPLGDTHAGLAKGDFKFVLRGSKLRGTWVLVRLKPRPGERQESWLLIKERDDDARPRDEYDLLAERPESVKSGLGVDDLGTAPPGASEPTSAAPPVGRDVLAAHLPRASPGMVDLELATLVDAPPSGQEWISEVKYDGYRVAILLDAGRARVFTRSHADWSGRFARLARAAEALPASSVLIDGEAVVFDDQGISRFALLQGALRDDPERIAYVAFDLLHLNGYDLRSLPLIGRKELLRELLAGRPADFPLHYADHITSDATAFHRQACQSDLEGVVCKRAGSAYIAGRGRDWLKVKCHLAQEFVIGGFTEGHGVRAGFGALLLGVWDGSKLVYAGRVGTGLDEATIAGLRARLDALESLAPPFEPPPHITGHVLHWARPELVAEVAFREWTADGVLRQPVFLGLREDKEAASVVRELPAQAPVASAAPTTAGEAPRTAHGDDALQPAPADAPAASSAELLGIAISNPGKRLFPDSAFTKRDLAAYYAAVAQRMLPHVAGRPLTLVRCPGGERADCFYQRHADTSMPRAPIRLFPHKLGEHEVEDWLVVDSAEGLVALAQMGVVEVHTWLSRTDAPTRPDQLVFDLDPGPGVSGRELQDGARRVAEECAALGFVPFLKATGGKGLHVVLPIEPVWEFPRVHALARLLAERVSSVQPSAFTTKMAKDARGGRIFIDYLRNSEGASVIAPYSTRNRPGPTCSVPLAWEELDEGFDARGFTPDRVLARISAGTDPWAAIEDGAVGVRVLRHAESALGG